MIWNVEPALICHIFTSVKLGKENLEKRIIYNNNDVYNDSCYKKSVYNFTIYLVTPTCKPNPNMPQIYLRKILFHKLVYLKV